MREAARGFGGGGSEGKTAEKKEFRPSLKATAATNRVATTSLAGSRTAYVDACTFLLVGYEKDGENVLGG